MKVKFDKTDCTVKWQNIVLHLKNFNILLWVATFLMLTCLPRHRCVSLLYSLPKLTNYVKEIHAQLIINGLKSPALLAKLIELYCASPHKHTANNASLVFLHFDRPDLFLFNTLIRCAQPKDSIIVFRNEFSRGAMVFDDYTYKFVFGACARSPSASTLWVGRQLHALMVKHGNESNILVPTTTIHFYASNKDIKSARRVFEEMEERSIVTWNAMITGYCSLKEGDKQDGHTALSLFHDMLVDLSGVKPTQTTIVCVLSAASQIGVLEIGACIHGFAEKTGYAPEDNVFIGTGLVDMYSKCGSLDSALSVFWRMKQRNVLTWTAMAAGLAIHGKGNQALEILYKMGAYDVKPNEVTFTSLFSACCHVGLVEEGLQLFHDMKRKFGMKPQIQHYGCIVDLLGRAGCLTEAYDFILEMPINADAVIWKSLLSACKIHGDVVMGEKVGKFLLQIEEQTCEELASKSDDYVALSNVYASAERWEDVETVRKEMKAKRILNKAGSSIVQTVDMVAL